ncbi:hypothetical protein IEQ34_012709 [Dendrobium chrysotoxum]|uniref:Uncharacterized protein n=1 Tax=Dendrobium chrysotoxum TaxID=161865 RepID=A0AAV7G6F7_DENCH|nr:hypothetical protein IEQ34_012709 [Dendrobium chrysotoxum]
MRVSEKEESMSPYWLSSTNWLVADGSLEGSISFETSSAEGAGVIPIGVLLERPADSPPCEITIFFRERHEIHSIYVRSSARVYEVYYASDRDVSSNDYLCTVRCGAAVQEVTQDMCEVVLAEDTVPNGINADFPRSNSNNVTEDGWVEVEVPDSLPPNDRRPVMSNISVENICPKTQIQYEATAEISDASPCMSVTLRLLSLQIKTSIHIDEVYIYADPVEDADPDPPVSNVGSSSLLSMLVPGLLQISKSRTSSSLQDKGFSDVFSTEGTIHSTCLDKFEMSELEASSMMGNSKVGLDQLHNEEKPEHPVMASSTSSKMVSDPDPASIAKTDENNGVRGCVDNLLEETAVRHTQTKPGDGKLILTDAEGSYQSGMAINNDTNAPYVRLEKNLDDLVSRMGKLENFCSSFQESILKPLTGIEMRLQRMEEKLDAFSKVPLPSETYPSTRISRLSAHVSSFENEGSKSSSAAADSSSHEIKASVNLLMGSLHESEKISGLVLKAPEFPDDDDNDDDESNLGYPVDLKPNNYPKNDKRASIDSALASALAAFVASTTDKSYLHNSHPMDVAIEQQNCLDHFLDSTADAVHSEDYRNSVPEWFLGDKNCDVLNEGQDEIYLSENSRSDVVDADSTSDKFNMIDSPGAKVQGNCLCDESLPADADSSAEMETHESEVFVIRAPEFPNEDDILDSGENFESHASNYPNVHSHALPHSGSTPLALFLSSRKVSPSGSSSNSHIDQLEQSSSDRNSFSLSIFQDQGGSDGLRTSSLESYVNAALKSSLVGFFFSDGGSAQQLDISHDTAVIGEENSSFIPHSMDNANCVLKCYGLHSNGTSKGCTITQSLRPCSGLHSDRSSISIHDMQCWVGDSDVRTAEGQMPVLSGKFEAVDSSLPSSFDDIFMSSKLHPECSDSNGMDSFIGSSAVTGQNSGQITGTGESSENIVQCQSCDGTSHMKSLFEPKQMFSFIPGQDDLTSNVKFCADKNFRSWLPLEILLCEKQADYQQHDQLKLGQEYLVNNLEFSVESKLRSGFPLEALLDENRNDHVANSDYGNAEYGKQHNSPPAQGFKQNSEIADNTLFDIEDNAAQSEIYSMVTPGTALYPVSFGSGNLFSSLI